MKEKVTQIQETQRVSIKRNPNVLSSRHIIIKMAKFKDKERILNTARGKQEVIYKGALIRLAADFSMKPTKPERNDKKYSSNENHRLATKTTLTSKDLN